jgi:hypothetical protein
MKDLLQLPNRVKAHAVKLGFTVSPLHGSVTTAWYALRATPTAAPVEVYFRREQTDAPWLWQTAIHRVHWSDPINSNNGGQPEMANYAAFKAYTSLLAVHMHELAPKSRGGRLS